MKRHRLLAPIIPLLFFTFITVQASQMDCNGNNTNEKLGRSSTYIHGDQTNWQKWIKGVEYKGLKEPLIELYRDGIARPTQHIQTTPKVYFVVGPKGAGKSTFISACQGNKVIEIKEKETWGSSDEDDNDNHNEGQKDPKLEQIGESGTPQKTMASGQLMFENTISLPTPDIADSTYGVTEGIKVYYTGRKKSKKPMAFCDTEGFLGKRKNNNSNAKKIVGAFAPHFALKANRIGGIIFVVAKADIIGCGGRNFLTCMRFLQRYFDLAVTDDNLATLKESVIMLITKQEGKDKEVATVKKLAKFIKETYEDYYKRGQIANKKEQLNNNQRPKQHLGQLKPFFKLFLKKDVGQNEIDTLTYKLIDEKKVRFFYPYKPEKVKKIRTKLHELTPLAPKYLSLQDNPISQYLIKQIIDKAYAINKIIHQALKSKSLALLQRIMLQKDNSKRLKALNNKLVLQQKRLKQQNYDIRHSEILDCVYENRHIEDIPVDRHVTNTMKKIYENVKKEFIDEGIIQGKGNFLSDDMMIKRTINRAISGFALPFAAAITAPFETPWRYVASGYLHKHFRYTVDDPIYEIEIKVENKGSITWNNPNKLFIDKHFTSKVEDTTTTLISKDNNGIKQNLWHIHHSSAYAQNARCYVKFFGKKNHLKASEWKVEDNEKKMKRIDDLLKELEAFKNMKKGNLKKAHQINQQTANEYIKELSKDQEEMNMINCWSKRIFKNESANQELIAQYMANYNEVVAEQYQVKNNMVALAIDNGKHIDEQPGLPLNLQDNYQPGQQLKKINQHIEGQEEQKEEENDHQLRQQLKKINKYKLNHKNGISSISRLNTSLIVGGITTILAGLLSTKKNNNRS